MGKRIFNLHNGRWPGDARPLSTHLTLQLLAVPLLVLAVLLLVDGVVSMSVGSIAIGVIGLLAALGLQRHGQG